MLLCQDPLVSDPAICQPSPYLFSLSLYPAAARRLPPASLTLVSPSKAEARSNLLRLSTPFHGLVAGDISSLDIAPVPEGRQRSKFLAVGDHASQVRILSLDPDDLMTTLAVQAVPAVPESLLIIDSPAMGG